MFVASFVLVGIGLLVFSRLNPGQLWLIPVYYLTFATGHATFVVMSQTVVADYFGTRRFATIRGLSHSTAMPLGLVGPVFAGWMFDRTGSYDIAFTVLSSCANLRRDLHPAHPASAVERRVRPLGGPDARARPRSPRPCRRARRRRWSRRTAGHRRRRTRGWVRVNRRVGLGPRPKVDSLVADSPE